MNCNPICPLGHEMNWTKQKWCFETKAKHLTAILLQNDKQCKWSRLVFGCNGVRCHLMRVYAPHSHSTNHQPFFYVFYSTFSVQQGLPGCNLSTPSVQSSLAHCGLNTHPLINNHKKKKNREKLKPLAILTLRWITFPPLSAASSMRADATLTAKPHSVDGMPVLPP